MKVFPVLQSLYILVRLYFTTLFNLSLRAIIQSFRGPSKMTPSWVDKTLENWARHVLNLVKVKLRIHRKQTIQLQSGKSYMIMCNHTSYFDIPISIVALNGWSVRMLAKKELYSVPLFGKALAVGDFPMIDRHNRRQSLKDLAHARTLMERGIVVWVAPEGTRSTTGTLGKFKRGGFLMAIEAKATIIPMVIRGAETIMPPNSCKLGFGQNVDVFIGDPIDASEYTLDQKDLLLERVRASMS